MRRAIRVYPISFQLLHPPFVEPIGNSDADARVILVQANAFELHAFAVEKKTRVFVESNRAHAKMDGYSVDQRAGTDHLGFEPIQKRILERPEMGFGYEKSLSMS